MIKNIMYGAMCFFFITSSICVIALTIHFSKPTLMIKRHNSELRLTLSDPMDAPYYWWELEKSDKEEARSRNMILCN